MDWWIVKQLRAMVLTDLREFVTPGYFEGEVDKFKLHDGIENSKHFSREVRWGYLAGQLGRRLFFESPAIMSARQVSASEVLMNLGMLAAAEAAHGTTQQVLKNAEMKGIATGNVGDVAAQLEGQIPTMSDNVMGALKLYLRYLTPFEAGPFLALLKSEADISNDKEYTTEKKQIMPQHYHFGDVTGSQIQIGSNGSTQTQHQTGNMEALSELIEVLRDGIEQGRVVDELRDELRAELATLQAQVASPKPKWPVIKAAANSIKVVLENAAGSAIAAQALPCITALLAI